MGELKLCDGNDRSALDASLTGHPWHCPACDRHLTSLFLCPECGIRYDEPVLRPLGSVEGPDREAHYHALARLLADRVPERVLQLAAELVTGKSY